MKLFKKEEQNSGLTTASYSYKWDVETMTQLHPRAWTYYINPNKINFISRCDEVENHRIIIRILMDNNGTFASQTKGDRFTAFNYDIEGLTFEYTLTQSNNNNNIDELPLANILWEQLTRLGSDVNQPKFIKLKNWECSQKPTWKLY